MFTLFFARGTCALASLIALEDAGAAYQIRRVDFKTGEQRSEPYLGINPKGRVPALLTERGILTETPAILAFLAQSFPAAKLAPLDDPFAFAVMQAFNSYLCSTVHVAHAHRMRGPRWADEASSHEDMKRRVPGNVAQCFETIQSRMFVGPWVMGEAYSTSDPYLFTLSQWLAGDGVDIAGLPRIAEHSERMRSRASVRRALEQEAAG